MAFAAHGLMKMAMNPNLCRRPVKPAKGNGRVQKAIRRAFIMEGAEVLSGTAIYDYSHPRRRVELRHLPSGIYRTTRLIGEDG
jgi:hypothetical protein